jgi:hypothetical protein
MSKLTIAGIASWLFSGILLGFQTIQTLMDPAATSLKKQKFTLKGFAIVDLLEPKYLEWIEKISWASIQNAVTYLVNMPLFILLFCLGIIFFLLNAFKSKL